MEEKEMNLSFFVITAFIALFFIFMIVKPDSSGYAVSDVVGSFGISGDFSILTLVLAFVTLIVFLGIILFVYKNLIRSKKSKKLIKPPVPKKEFLGEIEHGEDLFLENNKEPNKYIDFGVDVSGELKAKTVEKLVEKPVEQPKQEQKMLTNLNQLKNNIMSLINQRYQRQDIIGILKAKGWSIEQVVKAIDEINLDNLRAYIKKSLDLGFNKEQITEYLKRNGWEEDEILKAIPN